MPPPPPPPPKKNPATYIMYAWADHCKFYVMISVYTRAVASHQGSSPFSKNSNTLQGESLVDLDHVLDIIGHGYQLVGAWPPRKWYFSYRAAPGKSLSWHFSSVS